MIFRAFTLYSFLLNGYAEWFDLFGGEGWGETGVVEVGLEVIEETEGGFVVIMLGVPIGVLREGDFGAKEPTLGDPLQEISREAEGIGKILVKYFF